MTTYSDNDTKIARLNTAAVRGDVSVLDLHHLIAERGKKVRHVVERHELTMFEPKKFLELMRAAGLRSEFVKDGLMNDRGLHVGVKAS